MNPELHFVIWREKLLHTSTSYGRAWSKIVNPLLGCKIFHVKSQRAVLDSVILQVFFFDMENSAHFDFLEPM